MRRFSIQDQLFNEFQHALDTLSNKAKAQRANPAITEKETELTKDQQKKSQGFMRVNHTGEICAQALYRGQAKATKDTQLKQHLLDAANEEVDHLAWCEARLKELNTHTSYLNPFWYTASFIIGYCTAKCGDKISLGFVEETEKQVVEHLQNHQQALPSQDQKSRSIINLMTIDEAKHANSARDYGAEDLPFLLKCLMRLQSKVMTTTAYYL